MGKSKKIIREPPSAPNAGKTLELPGSLGTKGKLEDAEGDPSRQMFLSQNREGGASLMVQWL